MTTFTDIQPNQTVTATLNFPPLVGGENCCDLAYTATCGDETLEGSQQVCVEPEVDKTQVLLGLPTLFWSLQDQRLKDHDKVAWSFIAPKNMVAKELVTNHRIQFPETGSYSDGNGGLVTYQIWNGKLPNLGSRIHESGNIVFHTTLYGNRPANTVQPTRVSGNPSFNHFPIDAALIKGQWYTVVIERQTNTSNHGSVNSLLVPDEDRDRKDVECGILDECEWQIWRTPNGTNNWQRRNNQLAVFEITDGANLAFGNGYFGELDNRTSDRLYNLTGNNEMRWCFTTPYQSELSQICLGLVRRSGTDPVIVEIKDAANNVIPGTTVSLDFSSNPIPGPNPGPLANNDWALTFARWQDQVIPPVTLPAGQKYVCVRATGNSNFEIAGSRDASDSNWTRGYQVNPYDGCPSLVSGQPGGWMEISTNGGNSWQLPIQNPNNSSDDTQPALALKICNI